MNITDGNQLNIEIQNIIRDALGAHGAADVLRTVELPAKQYDIFLSHAAADAAEVDILKVEMTTLGLRVYVDRFDDSLPDRSFVDRETADQLRKRMRDCRILVLAVTAHSAASRWIPWELGFFDGTAGEVYVLPLKADVESGSPGVEFLGLYTWLDRGTAAATLLERSARARKVVHRQGEKEITNAQARHIEDFGPQMLRDPGQAMLWQRQILEATFKLQEAWRVAIQRAWMPWRD
ncbi:toll/interleukin-1 receptor domain-containing protein [Xanthobacter versatilis]|uniref:toll/interleukin-1 receptor domain-containing protein n=1 Tax=Xanthobacter autotrophicus (strain ATCC BAA-1158 / Py2) TaxID=78245 RepID=UPI00372AA4BD